MKTGRREWSTQDKSGKNAAWGGEWSTIIVLLSTQTARDDREDRQVGRGHTPCCPSFHNLAGRGPSLSRQTPSLGLQDHWQSRTAWDNTNNTGSTARSAPCAGRAQDRWGGQHGTNVNVTDRVKSLTTKISGKDYCCLGTAHREGRYHKANGLKPGERHGRVIICLHYVRFQYVIVQRGERHGWVADRLHRDRCSLPYGL